MLAVHKNAAAKKRTVAKPKNGPVTTVRAHKLAWAYARGMVDGNTSRLFITGDGSVIVANSNHRPRWL